MPELTLVVVLPILGVLIGITARTLVPYLQTIRDNPDTKFDKKFFLPALVSVVLNWFLVPATLATAGTLGTFVGGFVVGWGVSDMAREGQKFIESMQTKK